MAPTGQTSLQIPQPLQYFKLNSIPAVVDLMDESGQLIQQIRHSVHLSVSKIGRRVRQLPVIIPSFSVLGEGTVPANGTSFGDILTVLHLLQKYFVNPNRH